MTTVSLEGRLGQIVGDSFKFKTRTLREVLTAIEANTGKLRSYLKGNGKRFFAVFVNGKEVDTDSQLNVNVDGKKVLIIPILIGGFIATATAAITTALVGTTVVGISSAAAIATYKAVSFVVGTVLAAALSFGLSLLISKLMKPDDPKSANTTSFIFGQAENVTKQGVVVPVGYGRLQAGSRVVSVNKFSVDRKKFDGSGADIYAISQDKNNPDAEVKFRNNGGIIQMFKGDTNQE
jgi:predicted phage tail protein